MGCGPPSVHLCICAAVTSTSRSDSGQYGISSRTILIGVSVKSHLNPPTLHANPAFSQVVVVENPSKTVYVGGQNAVSVDGQIVGTTLAEQTTKTVQNVTAA